MATPFSTLVTYYIFKVPATWNSVSYRDGNKKVVNFKASMASLVFFFFFESD